MTLVQFVTHFLNLDDPQGRSTGDLQGCKKIEPRPEQEPRVKLDCMDAGGTSPRMDEVESRREQRSRTMQEQLSRAMHGAVAEEARTEELSGSIFKKEKPRDSSRGFFETSN